MPSLKAQCDDQKEHGVWRRSRGGDRDAGRVEMRMNILDVGSLLVALCCVVRKHLLSRYSKESRFLDWVFHPHSRLEPSK